MHQIVRNLEGNILSDSEVLHIFTMNNGLIAAMDSGMRPIQRARLPHFPIDPDWQFAVEFENGNQPRVGGSAAAEASVAVYFSTPLRRPEASTPSLCFLAAIRALMMLFIYTNR